MKRALIRSYFVVLLLFACSTLHAALTITDASTKITGFKIGYFYDHDASMTIDDVVKQSFTEIPSQFALGYREGNAWLKITIENKSSKDNFILSFNEVFWDELDLYDQQDSQWVIQENGLSVPVNERLVQTAIPAYALSIPPLTTKTVYVKGVSVSSHIGKFVLFSEEEFYRPDRFSLIDYYNIYSGVLFFIMFLVGFLYFTVRERVYVYYVCYVLSFISWISVQSGSYLSLGFPGWGEGLHAIGTLVVGFLILFSKQILQLPKNLPLTSKLFTFFAVVVFLSGVAITMQLPRANLFFNIFSSLFFAALIVVSIKAWRYHYFKEARYYLIALMVYMPTMGLMTLTYNGVLAYFDITRYAFTFGSLVEILCFSFILVSKYGEEKYHRLTVESQLNQERQDYQHHLEDEVEKRTRELDEANKQLLKQAGELEETKKQLSIEAKTDALSGLLNRRYFLRSAESLFNSAKESGQLLSLLMIDIDRFKGINDKFGHKAGDDVIRVCANIFLDILKNSVIVARYGGEEFAVLIPDAPQVAAMEIAENIRKTVEDTTVRFNNEKDIHITLSIGVTEVAFDADTSVEDMLYRADEALYDAKAEGRNHVVFLQK